MKFIIDRLEGDFAVLEAEDKTMLDVPRSLLPADAKEGDCLRQDGETYLLDEAEKAKRSTRIKRKMDALWN